MTESTLYSLFKAINHIHLLRGCKEDKLNLNLLEHIKDLIEENLLCCFYVKVNVLQDEQHHNLLVLLEITKRVNL